MIVITVIHCSLQLIASKINVRPLHCLQCALLWGRKIEEESQETRGSYARHQVTSAWEALSWEEFWTIDCSKDWDSLDFQAFESVLDPTPSIQCCSSWNKESFLHIIAQVNWLTYQRLLLIKFIESNSGKKPLFNLSVKGLILFSVFYHCLWLWELRNAHPPPSFVNPGVTSLKHTSA